MLDELLIFHVDVGFTDSRPVIADQHVSRVIVAAATEADAHCTAALMVMRPASPQLGIGQIQMPTSTRTILVEA